MQTQIPTTYQEARKVARKVNALELARMFKFNDSQGPTGNVTVFPGAKRPKWNCCTAKDIYLVTRRGRSAVVGIDTVDRAGYQVEKMAHEMDAPLFYLENVNEIVELNNESYCEAVAFNSWADECRINYTEIFSYDEVHTDVVKIYL